MRVFVTGASGFIGSATVRDLLAAGHQVIGMVRSEKSAALLDGLDVEIYYGSIDDPKSLQTGAEKADGVIHTAYNHDFSNYGNAAETDRQAIEAIGEVLAGSNRPFLVAGGTLGLKLGSVLTETDPASPQLPRKSESAILAVAEKGVRASVVRLAPSVHAEGDKGFITMIINTARAKGVSAYIGDGASRWNSVHRLDAASLFRLGLESAPAGSRLHAVGDEGVSGREIAELIGRKLNLPVVSIPLEQATEHFGFLGQLFAMDSPASSALTQQLVGWKPVQPGLLADMEQYYL